MRASVGCTEFLANVHPRGHDELADMTRAFARMIDYLQATAEAARRMSDGDLSAETKPHSERDVLGVAFVHMRERVTHMMREINSTSERLAASSQESGRQLAGGRARSWGDLRRRRPRRAGGRAPGASGLRRAAADRGRGARARRKRRRTTHTRR
jgi:methyl-accepting chemotaxis protein